jgi:membrane protein insertase Oxa1/YidC/SpoIIIJ
MGSGGTNDVVILMSILIFLVGLAFLSPLIQEATNQQYGTTNTDLYINTTLSSTDVPGPITWYTSSWGTFTNLFKAILWYFDWFPRWLTIFHIVIRFILVLVLYRLARSGAG